MENIIDTSLGIEVQPENVYEDGLGENVEDFVEAENLPGEDTGQTPDCPPPHASVSMEKICSPAYIDKGDVFSVQYFLTNNDAGANLPIFTKLALSDPLFTLTNYAQIISTTNICGEVNTKNGVAFVDLSSVSGLLKPGQTATVVVDFEAMGEIPKNSGILYTTATGGFFAPPDYMLCAAAACQLIYSNGELSIEKQLLSETPLLSENTALYKITITNNGNSDSVIPSGGFNDCPPLDKLCDIRLLEGPGEIICDGTRIYNAAELILSPGEILNVEFSARIL